MSDTFHIIITGEKNSTRSFQISRKKVFYSLLVTGTLITGLFCASLLTAGLYTHNIFLGAKIKKNERTIKTQAEANGSLQQTMAALERDYQQKFTELRSKKQQEIIRLELESSRKIAELEKINIEQKFAFKKEMDTLFSTAINDLNSRSEFIEDIITKLGIKVKTPAKETSQNSGGPFIEANETDYDDLLFKADTYLKTIKTVPLGKPTDGSVSSWYGKRKDPINGKNAFHRGIDLRGRTGDRVLATADGKVIYAGKKTGYGKIVILEHGNGYISKYAHLHNYHVKKGDFVTRGQTIGLVGNTGRSTGPHLHYEIAFNGKSVNPSKFMKVANLTYTFK